MRIAFDAEATAGLAPDRRQAVIEALLLMKSNLLAAGEAGEAA